MTNLITLCQSVAACRRDVWFFIRRGHSIELKRQVTFTMTILHYAQPRISPCWFCGVRDLPLCSDKRNVPRGRIYDDVANFSSARCHRDARRRSAPAPGGPELNSVRIEILYYCGNGAVRNFIWSNVHARLTTNTEA